jgi:hypothetical protein
MRDALRPFSPEEREKIFAAADSIRIRGHPDEYVGWLVRFFMWTGCHMVLLYDDRSISVQGGRLVYTRAKNRKPMDLPLKAEAKPWIERFLAEKHPGQTRLKEILAQVGQRAGIPCNFLRFRHTACIIFYKELGLPSTDVCRLMGVVPETLVIYAERPIDDLEEDMRDKGW